MIHKNVLDGFEVIEYDGAEIYADQRGSICVSVSSSNIFVTITI